jgi:hypothetical protein
MEPSPELSETSTPTYVSQLISYLHGFYFIHSTYPADLYFVLSFCNNAFN